MQTGWTEQDDYDREFYRVVLMERWYELATQARSAARQIARTLAPQLRVYTRDMHRIAAQSLSQADYKRHRRRCAVCNPAGFPPPLCVNGHEYHRRQKARRRNR